MSDKKIKKQNRIFVPDYIFDKVTDISPGFLKDSGVRFLMLDMDNTLAAYDEHIPADDIREWVNLIIDSGIKLFVISNTTRDERVSALSRPLGLDFITRAGKPSPRSLIKAMSKTGFLASESALAGDQILTDVIAANKAGVTSIVVTPRKFTSVVWKLRYLVELPIRRRCCGHSLSERS